jgi:hypothetical protein
MSLPRSKETRAAMVAKFGEGTFLYDGTRFGLTGAELQAHEKRLAGQEKGEGDTPDLE